MPPAVTTVACYSWQQHTACIPRHWRRMAGTYTQGSGVPRLSPAPHCDRGFGLSRSAADKDPAAVNRKEDISSLGPPRPSQQPVPAEGQGSRGQPFQWERQWYPLVPVSYVDRSRPRALTVLGHNLVLWHHAPSVSWQCLEDRCPHRLAPLSEGHIEPSSSSLVCSYHGWSFGPGGQCLSIPQADSPGQQAAALGSPRSCAASYPVREEQGLLWVWMDPGKQAALESSVWPVGLPTELQNGSGMLLGDWFMRDLPVSYEYLLENLLDPSHVHWAHHGVIGRRSSAGPINLVQQGELTVQGGFAVRIERTGMPGGMPAVSRFVPPSLTWLSFNSGGGPMFSMLFYAVPVAPGHSRLFAGYSTSAAPQLVRRTLASGALTPLLHAVQWLGDLGAHQVIDGDAIFLRRQEESVAGRGWSSAPYFMPAGCDRGVVLLRRWLDTQAGGGPTYGPAATHAPVLVPLPRERILDRYEQHTKNCPYCSQALRTTQALRSALSIATVSGFAAGFTLAVLQALLLPQLGPRALLAPPVPLPLSARGSAPFLIMTGALACALLNQALGQLESRFRFADYTHWDK